MITHCLPRPPSIQMHVIIIRESISVIRLDYSCCLCSWLQRCTRKTFFNINSWGCGRMGSRHGQFIYMNRFYSVIRSRVKTCKRIRINIAPLPFVRLLVFYPDTPRLLAAYSSNYQFFCWLHVSSVSVSLSPRGYAPLGDDKNRGQEHILDLGPWWWWCTLTGVHTPTHAHGATLPAMPYLTFSPSPPHFSKGCPNQSPGTAAVWE